jgi:SAM-dependent methyltransferase
VPEPAPRLYGPLAPWWPLLSAPSDYAEEAAFYQRILEDTGAAPLETVLELGSGGGNNASHMKRRFRLTLVDASEGMLDVSRALNPECEHIRGDMRSLRLGREFDAVFVHDAIAYMTTEDDLRAAIATARVHCRPGGAAIFAPDHVRETFSDYASHGGHDGADGRGLRYVMWCWDPDPADSTHCMDFAYLLREADGSVRAELDRHVVGLFPRATWLGALDGARFTDARIVPFEHSEVEEGLELYVARAPCGAGSLTR